MFHAYLKTLYYVVWLGVFYFKIKPSFFIFSSPSLLIFFLGSILESYVNISNYYWWKLIASGAMGYLKMKSILGRGIVMHKRPRTTGKNGEEHLWRSYPWHPLTEEMPTWLSPIPSPGEVVMGKSNNRIQLWHLQEVASEVQWNGKPTAGSAGNTEHNYGISKHKLLPAQIELLIYRNYLF